MALCLTSGRRIACLLAAMGLLLVSLSSLGAALADKATPTSPPAGPKREKLPYKRVPIIVERHTTVSADDLGLPFLPGAKVVKGYAYRVMDEKGQVLDAFATAVLTSNDEPEKVAQTYSRQMPGQPRPELFKDKDGPRWVLAVGSEKETRSVTVRPVKGGSTIELVRASKPVEPKQPSSPPRAPRGPRERRGPNAPGGYSV